MRLLDLRASLAGFGWQAPVLHTVAERCLLGMPPLLQGLALGFVLLRVESLAEEGKVGAVGCRNCSRCGA